MKKFLITLMLIPALLHAQTDSKYMAGAVPEVDGKVVFTRTLNVPELSKDQIYNAILDWGNQTFTGKSGRVLYSDPDKGTIAFHGEEEILIKIGLFPGKVKALYMLSAKCDNGKCNLETSRIRYKNNPSSKSSEEIITAEEYITDKYALNKAKTKIFRGTGDYRSKTIDIVDRLANEAKNAVYAYNGTSVHQNNVQNAQQISAQPVVQSAQIPAQLNGKISEKISEEIKQAIAKRGLSVVAVNGRQLSNPVTGKSAVDISSDKAAIMFTVESNIDNIMFIMEMAENFTLVLMNENDSEIVLTIECKRVQQFNNMFVGEILDVK